MRANLKDRAITFIIEDGCLVRTVAGVDGRSYVQRCSNKVFETVAHAVEETPAQGDGTCAPDISRRENLPFTQVDVALSFLKERGIVDVRHRRCYPASQSVHLDAMTEFHALAEERG